MDEDTLREIQKAYGVLLRVDKYFRHQTQMNAQLHMTQAKEAPLVTAVRSSVTSMHKVITALNRKNGS